MRFSDEISFVKRCHVQYLEYVEIIENARWRTKRTWAKIDSIAVEEKGRMNGGQSEYICRIGKRECDADYVLGARKQENIHQFMAFLTTIYHNHALVEYASVMFPRQMISDVYVLSGRVSARGREKFRAN